MKNTIHTFKFTTLVNFDIFILDYLYEAIWHCYSFLMFIESYSYIIFGSISTLIGMYFSYTFRTISFHFDSRANNLIRISDLIIKKKHHLNYCSDKNKVFVSNNLLFRTCYALEERIIIKINNSYFVLFISKANSLTKELKVLPNFL